jgi:tetrahydromethanopterin S-methyltransferase subunit E
MIVLGATAGAAPSAVTDFKQTETLQTNEFTFQTDGGVNVKRYGRCRRCGGWPMKAVRDADMSAKDHNQTLVGIHFAVGAFFAFWLLASPWIIAQNFRRAEQVPQAILVFGIVAALAALMFSTAFAMHRMKPIGRTLAMYSAALLTIFLWPAGIYTWWFIHTRGAKELYGVAEQS